MADLPSREELERILVSAHTVAVLGAHPDPDKPAHYVPAYLQAQGYEVLPVNPTYPGVALWGHEPAATLAELQAPVDVVEVFRRSEHLPDHVADILAMEPLPAVVWLQQGIRHPEVARELEANGITVVQDACMMVQHKKLGLQTAPTPRRGG